MVTAVLIISYLVFLCRGVPDSIIGAAWPAMYTEFEVSESLLSVLTIGVSFFTAIASLLSAKIILRFGMWKTLVISLLLLACTVLGFGLSESFILLCFLSISIGLCAGTIDNALNGYLATRYKAVFINLLHGFYGLGAILSPFLISLAISKGSWRDGYYLAFYVLMGVWALLLISYFAWKKVGKSETTQSSESEDAVAIPLKKQLKNRKIILACLVGLTTNALEYSTGVWGATFFVNSRGISEAVAASIITVLYVGMTAGRLLGAFLTIKITPKKLIAIAIVIMIPVCILFMFDLGVTMFYILMFIFGFANGPVYPLLISGTPEIFGNKESQSIIGTELAAAYVGCMLTHVILGILVKLISIAVLPYYVIISFILMAVVYMTFIKATKQE
ncbi:MAG: MFS transporter [Ruminococcaceae bacterium]|nr:MFS transporter [Oscillospiraceae bacterium]